MKALEELVQRQYNAGKAAYEIGRLDLAVDLLSRAIRLSDTDFASAENHVQLAQVFRTLGSVYQTSYNYFWGLDRKANPRNQAKAYASYINAVRYYAKSRSVLRRALTEGINRSVYELEDAMTLGCKAHLILQKENNEPTPAEGIVNQFEAKFQLFESDKVVSTSEQPQYEFELLLRMMQVLGFKARFTYRKRLFELTRLDSALEHERYTAVKALVLGHRVLEFELLDVDVED